MNKQDSALNNPQGLICHETQPNHSQERTTQKNVNLNIPEKHFPNI